MFKNIALFTLVGLLLAGSGKALACDACGCGVGRYLGRSRPIADCHGHGRTDPSCGRSGSLLFACAPSE